MEAPATFTDENAIALWALLHSLGIVVTVRNAHWLLRVAARMGDPRPAAPLASLVYGPTIGPGARAVTGGGAPSLKGTP